MMNLHEYKTKVNVALENVDVEYLREVVKVIHDSVLNRRRIFIAGNGGSAATASHFVTDLNKSYDEKGNSGRAISLCDNSSVITAVANDDNFENIFSTQLENLADPSDLLILISASGTSKNLLAAANTSRKIGLKSIGLLGFDGGELLNNVDMPIHTPTASGEYGPSEDAHSIICHFITSELRKSLLNG